MTLFEKNALSHSLSVAIQMKQNKGENLEFFSGTSCSDSVSHLNISSRTVHTQTNAAENERVMVRNNFNNFESIID